MFVKNEMREKVKERESVSQGYVFSASSFSMDTQCSKGEGEWQEVVRSKGRYKYFLFSPKWDIWKNGNGGAQGRNVLSSSPILEKNGNSRIFSMSSKNLVCWTKSLFRQRKIGGERSNAS